MPRPEAFKGSSTVTGAWWREADRTKTENATTAFAVWPNGSTRWAGGTYVIRRADHAAGHAELRRQWRLSMRHRAAR